ncbi:MAG: formate dehydrogenase accessory protein FdhE, partial [bacterium]|nr:formate dehydrogenase accessory protein FdhE [bacterium]
AARLHGGGVEEVLTAWLVGGELEPVDRYLARATMAPLLEALPGVRALCAAQPAGCPACGGPPQLSWLGASGESLVAARRSLLCARCQGSWTVPRAACPGCGELVTVHAERSATEPEPPVFPHLRIEGCEHCHRYVIGVDLGKDTQAMPEVDELAAIPLALYASDLGLTKLTPNLMGM